MGRSYLTQYTCSYTHSISHFISSSFSISSFLLFLFHSHFHLSFFFFFILIFIFLSFSLSSSFSSLPPSRGSQLLQDLFREGIARHEVSEVSTFCSPQGFITLLAHFCCNQYQLIKQTCVFRYLGKAWLIYITVSSAVTKLSTMSEAACPP